MRIEDVYFGYFEEKKVRAEKERKKKSLLGMYMHVTLCLVI